MPHIHVYVTQMLLIWTALHLMQVLLLTSIGNLQCDRLIIVILNYILFEIMVHRNYVYIQH